MRALLRILAGSLVAACTPGKDSSTLPIAVVTDASSPSAVPDASLLDAVPCDPGFPNRLRNVTSIDDVPDGRGMAVSAQEAVARSLSCYAPGPHTAFNFANWCCKSPALALTWIVWRPCLCDEGCSAISEPVNVLHDGTVTRIAQGMESGKTALVTAASGSDGRPVFVLEPYAALPDGGAAIMACDYRCRADRSNRPLDRHACETGDGGGRDKAFRPL